MVRRSVRDSRLATGHRPEATLLYELVEKHHLAFLEALERDDRSLPTHVQQEFEAYLKCGRLEHRFLRVCCNECLAERLVAFSCSGGASAQAAARGAWWRPRHCWWMKSSPASRLPLDGVGRGLHVVALVVLDLSVGTVVVHQHVVGHSVLRARRLVADLPG